MQEYMEIVVAIFALIAAISVFFMVRMYKQVDTTIEKPESESNKSNLDTLYEDEVIAVRKTQSTSGKNIQQGEGSQDMPVLVLHVMAKDNKQFVGYELLQALLSQGLRFGHMDIFHRYHDTNGKGPVMFSLASAMEPGTFDMHNMGAHRSKGLTLFMQLSGNQTIDGDRFDMMYNSALNLASELDGRLFDNKRQPFNETTLVHYHSMVANEGAKEEVA